jgi:hypothetical protein
MKHALKLVFPKRGRGRPGNGAESIYQEQRRAFCEAVLEIRSTLDFDVSSRGWAYIFENRNIITKAEIDSCQELINHCRKSGELPLNICSVDESRAFENVDYIDDTDAEDEASNIFDRIRNAHHDYNPFSFWDFQDCYIQVVVEKIDLRSLFSTVCAEFHVPIANAKGWADINLRADMMRRFAYWAAKGKRCILLYCGDFDPAGLHISEYLRSNLQDLAGAVGWDPTDLIIERFGLNHEFIVENNLTWIDNLMTASGKLPLDDPRHSDHHKPYVQSYISQYGVRKVEANALVVAPEAGRALCRAAIERHISTIRIPEYEAALQDARDEVASSVRRLLAESHGGADG